MRAPWPRRKPPCAALALLAALLCAAAPPAAAGGGRRALQHDDLALPSRLSDLCSSVVVDNGQFLPADGFKKEDIGPLLRLETPTANWGYYRFGTNSSNPALVLLAGFGDALAGWPLQLLDTLRPDGVHRNGWGPPDSSCTTLSAGKADELVPPANSEAMAQQLPNAQLLLLAGAYTSWLQQADVFLPALQAFLNQE